MSFHNKSRSKRECLFGKAAALKKSITYSSVAEVLSALYVLPLCQILISTGKVNLHDPHSVISHLIAASLFFFIFRSAARALIGLFTNPDIPIWGEPPTLSDREFEILLERIERMTRQQADVALSHIGLIQRRQKNPLQQDDKQE
jgi:hypothetical protein